MKKISKEQLIWAGSAVVATFVSDGHWPRLDLMFNFEYLSDIFWVFVSIAVVGFVIGLFFSIKKKGEEHIKNIILVATIINILVIIGKLYASYKI